MNSVICSVRVATPLDAIAISAVLQASYPPLLKAAYPPEVLSQLLPLMVRANPRLLASGTYYVAEADGTVVGCGGWTHEYPGLETDLSLGHLRHFATHQDWTRRGIGRAIYDKCEMTARAVGVCAFECNSSLNGVGFYSSLGFVSVREVDVPMTSGLMMRGMWMRRILE
jgi:N-acetylglutamate synthase-like GNAT family acetyltransferase